MFLLKKRKENGSNETFLVAQWLRFLTSTAAGVREVLELAGGGTGC